MSQELKTGPPGAGSSRQKRWLNGALSLSLLVAGVSAVWYVSRPRGPEPPPVDSTQTDPEIVEIIAEGRDKVIQNPSSGRAWGRLGLVLWAHDYFEQANFCLAQAERLDAQDPRWPYFQGIMLMLTDPAAGIECFRRAAERAGDADASVRLRLAEALLDAGRLAEAEAHLKQAFAQDPQDIRAHFDMSRLALLKQDWPSAIELLSACLTDEHARRRAHTMRALAYRRLGQHQRAQEDEDRASRLAEDQGWPDPFIEQGQKLQRGLGARIETAGTLRRLGRLDQAIPILEDTARKYPASTIPWFTLADIWHDMNAVERAEEACRHIIQIDPEAAQGWYGLGWCQAIKQPREAVTSFRRAIQLKPDHAAAHFDLAECLNRLNDTAGAAAEYRATLRCRPDYEPARAALKELERKLSQDDGKNVEPPAK
jgi:tetratricopeptide (TPR) repeat protein